MIVGCMVWNGAAALGESANAPTAGAKRPGPLFVCDQSTYDFGEVWAWTRVEHSFPVRNDGDADLQILEVKPACSCTLVPNFQRVIKPGETAMLPSILDTRHKKEKVEAALELITNEPAGENHRQLKVTGMVRTVCQMTPLGENSFYNVQPGQSMTKELTLTNTSGRPLKLEVEPLPEASPFKVSLREQEKGQVFIATVTAAGPFKEGSNPALVQFKTNIAESPIYRLELNAYVPPRIMVNPPEMWVTGQQREGQSRPLIVMNNGTEPFDIVSYQASQPFLQPSLTKKDDKSWNFAVTIPSYYRPPPQGERIVFRTTDKERPEIVVRVIPKEVPPPVELVPEEFRERLQGFVRERTLPTTRPATGT